MVEVPPPETVRFLVTLKSVEVAFPNNALSRVEEAEFKFWMVDEPRVMREFGILTSPFAFTRKSEDVPEPFAVVVVAISKSGVCEPKVCCMVSFAHGDDVPSESEPETY